MENIRKLGSVVNTAIVLGGAEAIITDRDRTLLDTSSWKSLLSRMGYVKRKATTKGNVAVEAFETIKASFLDDVYATVSGSAKLFRNSELFSIAEDSHL